MFMMIMGGELNSVICKDFVYFIRYSINKVAQNRCSTHFILTFRSSAYANFDVLFISYKYSLPSAVLTSALSI
ncbi:hypothetical protein HE1_00137 [Holospora elegans E1]|uniref:Uncharacterized protein n=1 Tax=Holospora elegans E1 TaxID=1427503 RepID=A0A023DX59_9PROT|nr:hypothetical protein HE1_00137 [Holospora elegans E1]